MRIELRRGDRAAVLDTLGGELVSYRDSAGTEYIWQGDPSSWTGRNPLLFPIVGALKDGAATAFGRACRMPQHGFARRREFTVTEQGPDFAVLELREDPDSLAAYPYPFRLIVRQGLVEDGFTTTATVENTGDAVMPFCLGAHTAFNCPLGPGERFEDYQLVFDQAECLPAILPTADGLLDRRKTLDCIEGGKTIPLRHEVFDQVDTLTFEGLCSRGVSLRHRNTGRGVHMDFTGFPMLAFWTKPHAAAPYLCIEPWQGCADTTDGSGKLEEKPYRVLLQPGETWSRGYTVTTL